MKRNTKQKLAVINYLKSVKCHPDAQIIHQNVKKIIPNISLGTIYRILGQLGKDGKILELNCQEQTRYDGDMSQHGHFICQECDCVIDVSEIPDLKNLEIKFKEEEINNYKIYLYGKCKRCQQ